VPDEDNKKIPAFDASKFSWTSNNRQARNYSMNIKEVDPANFNEGFTFYQENGEQTWNSLVFDTMSNMFQALTQPNNSENWVWETILN